MERAVRVIILCLQVFNVILPVSGQHATRMLSVHLPRHFNTVLCLAKGTSNSDPEPAFVTTRVAMRDGVELAVDYFVPSTSVKYACIVEITPYGRTANRPNFRNEAGYWLQHGYAFIIADARGTGESSGDFVYLTFEGKDGHDLVEWIARQPWSSGRVWNARCLLLG